MAEAEDKFDFVLEQMAELRASVTEGPAPTQSTLELQQKLDKALNDNASLRTQVAKCDEDIAAVRAQISVQDNAKTLRLATIERQLMEAVEARDSSSQIIKQKSEEIEKLKLLLESSAAAIPLPPSPAPEKKVENKEEKGEDEEDGSEEPQKEERDYVKDLERTENELMEISDKYPELNFFPLIQHWILFIFYFSMGVLYIFFYSKKIW